MFSLILHQFVPNSVKNCQRWIVQKNLCLHLIINSFYKEHSKYYKIWQSATNFLETFFSTFAKTLSRVLSWRIIADNTKLLRKYTKIYLYKHPIIRKYLKKSVLCQLFVLVSSNSVSTGICIVYVIKYNILKNLVILNTIWTQSCPNIG